MANPVRDLINITPGTVEGAKAMVPNARGKVSHPITAPGGDSANGYIIDLEVLAGNGLRQSALQINVNRASGEDHVWDGNPDAGLKMGVTNRAANADNEGAARCIDLSARNRGTNMSWLNGGNIGCRNDSGSIAYILTGLQTRVENYGTLNTEAVGYDINLSIESDTGSPLKYGLRIRNTDQSGMSACDAAIHVLHTSTNGFDHFAHLATNSGDGAVANAVTPSGATVEALIIKIGANTRYIPVYAALTMN
jgi:hypothetical protein